MATYPMKPKNSSIIKFSKHLSKNFPNTVSKKPLLIGDGSICNRGGFDDEGRPSQLDLDLDLEDGLKGFE
jgi:hypothetical protein